MQIRFADLVSQNTEIHEQIERELVKLHLEAGYIGGAQVKAFEEEFAAFLGVRHAVSVGSGTDALRLALLAVGVGPGTEVITTPMTFIATAAAIHQTGARPTLVDVDPETCNIDPRALRRYLQERRQRSPHGLRAIVPVHLYGLPAAMREIQEIALEFGLRMVEDACQAHGASFHDGHRWRYAGTLGAAGCFSFYPGKNLGAWGDGGAVVTDNDELAERVRMLRDHGRISHYAHQDYGYNSRLDAIQAVVLRAKLRRLPDWNRRRGEIAQAYRELLDGAELVLPVEPEGFVSANHLFPIRSHQRDAIRQALLSKNIECGIHYPVPLHLQPACRDLGYQAKDFPVSEQVADTELSLPMHPHLIDSEVRQVAEAVLAVVHKRPLIFAGEHRLSPAVSALSPERGE
jgi:dTDP-4-amino-4,6-dideoxygalactose transaminase